MKAGEYSPAERVLTEEELGQLFDVAAKIEDPELVPSLVMGAYHIRDRREHPQTDSDLALNYDFSWERLLKEGVSPPISDDPRRAEDPNSPTYLGHLRPEFLYVPRDEYLARVTEEDKKEAQELIKATHDAYLKISEATDSSDADFLLSLVGARVEDNDFVFSKISPKKLSQVREITMLMAPSMRDFIRMNAGLWKLIEPNLVLSLEGTDLEVSGMTLEELERRKAITRAMLAEHVDVLDC